MKDMDYSQVVRRALWLYENRAKIMADMQARVDARIASHPDLAELDDYLDDVASVINGGATA